MIAKKHVGSCMAHAFLCAAKSKASDVAVGAVLARALPDGTYHIVSDGYNGTPAGEKNATTDEQGRTTQEVRHAERNAIRKAALSGNLGSDGLCLFVTHAPCLQCAMLIYDMGIKTVYYAHEYKHSALMYLIHRNIDVRMVDSASEIEALIDRAKMLVNNSRVD